MTWRCFRIIAGMLLAAATKSGRADENDRPTAAFIDVGRHAIGPVLEQALLRSEKATWLRAARSKVAALPTKLPRYNADPATAAHAYYQLFFLRLVCDSGTLDRELLEWSQKRWLRKQSTDGSWTSPYATIYATAIACIALA